MELNELNGISNGYIFLVNFLEMFILVPYKSSFEKKSVHEMENCIIHVRGSGVAHAQMWLF